jgi:acyl-coenzyme A thioesterase PaaI-like protein
LTPPLRTARSLVMKASTLRHLINLWPPLLFSGIRVTKLAPDYRSAETRLKLGWYNRNYVGVAFGGSLFAMTDPVYMLLLLKTLGPGYVVWDKAASIEYIAPGRGTVTRFVLDDEALAAIRAATAGNDKHLAQFPVDIVDQQGAVVARVVRTVHVRRKKEASRA